MSLKPISKKLSEYLNKPKFYLIKIFKLNQNTISEINKMKKIVQ